MSSVFLPEGCYEILVVDDDPDILQYLEVSLKKEGYRVWLARDGETALDVLNNQTIHLVLSDVDMPGMDGYELVRQVKDNQHIEMIPFLFFSAHNQSDDRIRGLELGAIDYISKPLVIKEVCLRVRNTLSQRAREESRRLKMVEAALNLIQLGVVVLNPKGRVTVINWRANEILKQNDGIYLQNTRLVGTNPAATKRIERMVTEVRELVDDFDPSKINPLRIKRPSLARDFALIALPLDLEESGRGRTMSLIIHDPETTTIPSTNLLINAYQFTKAEARVASLLIQGLTIKEICDDLDVSRNTVSSHLKKLFMKTDTQRQSDFTRLLLSGLSQLKLP